MGRPCWGPRRYLKHNGSAHASETGREGRQQTGSRWPPSIRNLKMIQVLVLIHNQNNRKADLNGSGFILHDGSRLWSSSFISGILQKLLLDSVRICRIHVSGLIPIQTDTRNHLKPQGSNRFSDRPSSTHWTLCSR